MTANGDRYRTATVESVDVDGTVVPVHRFGSGPPLLFVHGFPLSGFTWRHVIPEFASTFTCLAVDLPGLGESLWTDRTDFSFPGQGVTLHRVADALGLDGYGVVADDTGGTFARYLALVDGRVSHLALINTEIPGHRPPWIPTYQALMRLPGAAAILGALTRSSQFVRSPMGFGGCFADSSLLGGEFRTEFIEPIIGSAVRRDGIRRYLLGAQWEPVDELRTRHAEITIPVRLIWGRDDPTFPLADARPMVDQFPDAELVEVADAKLLPHEERPDDVVRVLREFLVP